MSETLRERLGRAIGRANAAEAMVVIREHLQSGAAVESGRQALLAAMAGSPYAKDAARAVIAAALDEDRD